jgi:organic anion transporter 4A
LLFFSGQAAFLPKYLESQFGLTPGHAAMIVGCIVVPAGAGGTLIGGFSLKKFNLKREGAIRMYITCQCIILPLYLGFMLHCPTPEIVGLTRAYPGLTGLNNQIHPIAPCNSGCDCIPPDNLLSSQEGNFLI